MYKATCIRFRLVLACDVQYQVHTDVQSRVTEVKKGASVAIANVEEIDKPVSGRELQGKSKHDKALIRELPTRRIREYFAPSRGNE